GSSCTPSTWRLPFAVGNKSPASPPGTRAVSPSPRPLPSEDSTASPSMELVRARAGRERGLNVMTKPAGVGYRTPPKVTRWKPGQSGNPKGRPRGSLNLATDLSAELGE